MPKTITVILFCLLGAISIGGFLAWHFWPKSVAPSLTKETTNWKIYKNDAAGFEIQYPADFNVYEKGGEITFESTIWENYTANHPFIGINIYATDLSPLEWLDKDVTFGPLTRESDGSIYINSNEASGTTAKELVASTSIGGAEAIKYYWWGVSAGGDNILIKNSNQPDLLYRVYRHLAGALENPEQTVSQSLFDQMLSTFKFIQQDKTSGWKTYTNAVYGYEIKYPANWYLKEGSSGITIQNTIESVDVVGNEGTQTPNGSIFSMAVPTATSFASIREVILQGDLPENAKRQRVAQVKDMEIAGAGREVWQNMGAWSSGVQFIANGKKYTFDYMSGSEDQFRNDLAIFNQILSTFKFINQ